MKIIEIITTQNVPIQYETADLKDRIIATILDLISLWLIYGVFGFIFIRFLVQDIKNSSDPLVIVFYVVMSLFTLFFGLFQEVIFRGQTIGKKIMAIKVIKLNGEVPRLPDYIMRWIFKPIDIWGSLGSIGSLLISSGENSQRLGDVLANTTVIKLSGSRNISLQDLENIPQRETATVKYPDVVQFTDDEMLGIRQLLERVRLYRTEKNLNLYHQVVEELANKLALEKVPNDGVQFLKDLITDYVILTR